MWKFKCLKGRDKWLFLLTIGAVLCILAFPVERLSKNVSAAGILKDKDAVSVSSGIRRSTDTVSSSSGIAGETVLEARVRSLLEHVDGIGHVDVMIVQAAPEEAVVRTGSLFEDLTGTSSSENEENPSAIQGIIISADGGGSPVVQTEICEAMEALFGLPAHKIKVLKRVE